MNDPNGLVYEDGTWHLFFQHNPHGTRWGNMSWGHATSTDLVHWEEQPVAIPQTFDADGVAIEDIFSGSVVVDEQNTSGFGTAENPPMVAVYTSAYTPAHPTHAGKQAQSLAYSTDHGRDLDEVRGQPGVRPRLGELPRPEGHPLHRPRHGRVVLGHGRGRGAAVQGRALPQRRPEDLDPPQRLRPRQRDRRHLGVPRPVPARGRRRPGEHQVGAWS